MLNKIKEELLDIGIAGISRGNILITSKAAFNANYGDKVVLINSLGSINAASTADLMTQMTRITVWYKKDNDSIPENDQTYADVLEVVEFIRNGLQHKLLTGMSSPLVLINSIPVEHKDAYGRSMVFSYTEVLT